MVSVIIPVYNGEQYLREAVDSVIEQSYADWELILVDDGSTDASPAICDEYAARDGRIRVLHTPNGGLSAARNRGLDIAKGSFISFLDADDVLHRQGLETLVKNQNDFGCDVVIAGMTYDKNILSSDIKKVKQSVLTPLQTISAGLYQKRVLVSACAKLYASDLFNSVRFTNGLYFEDLDFFVRCYGVCKSYVLIDTKIYYYRQHSGSFIHQFDDRRADVLKVTDRIEEFALRLGAEGNARSRHTAATLLRAARERKLSANFNIFILASRYGKADLADKCWQTIKMYRWSTITNPKVRLKSRLGALLSYLGRRAVLLFAKSV